MALSFFTRKKSSAPLPSAESAAPKKAFPPPPYLLNLGCGSCFHPAWLNLDFAPQSSEVFQHDLRKPLPFAAGTARVIYHSHVLEHFTRTEARQFIGECGRVLEPGGILRVVVPDLETIARLYLKNLHDADGGETGAAERHQWMTIELVDQLAREQSGGEMLKYWRQNPMPQEEFVIQRLGREVQRFLEYFRGLPVEEQKKQRELPDPTRTALKVGEFRLGGEVHKWMYDRVSLKALLEGAGFREVRQCRADESGIPDFHKYGLDLHNDGTTRKPDSLFMEGLK